MRDTWERPKDYQRLPNHHNMSSAVLGLMWELWHCCVYLSLARIKMHFPDVIAFFYLHRYFLLTLLIATKTTTTSKTMTQVMMTIKMNLKIGISMITTSTLWYQQTTGSVKTEVHNTTIYQSLPHPLRIIKTFHHITIRFIKQCLCNAGVIHQQQHNSPAILALCLLIILSHLQCDHLIITEMSLLMINTLLVMLKFNALLVMLNALLVILSALLIMLNTLLIIFNILLIMLKVQLIEIQSPLQWHCLTSHNQYQSQLEATNY